jgi:hypothetical protein
VVSQMPYNRRTFPRTVPFVLLAVLICPPHARAQSFAFWGDLIYTLVQNKQVEWTAVGYYRSDESLIPGTIFTRVSTEAKIAASSRLRLWVQYTLINEGEQASGRNSWNNRPQVGLIYRLRTFGANNVVTSETRFQRNLRTGGESPSNDYRQAFELRNDKKRISPWFREELFFDNSKGFFRTRSRVGIIVNLKEGRQLALAYQFQSNKNDNGSWAPEHTIVARFWIGNHLSWRGRNP